MAIASPIWGALADRYGRKPMVERSMFDGAVILLLMAVVRSAEELVLQALVGVVLGGIIPAISALLSGHTQPGEEGTAYGLDNSIKIWQSRRTPP
jgi:DHA1 family multidrug resistance protein-like MFS transporter